MTYLHCLTFAILPYSVGSTLQFPRRDFLLAMACFGALSRECSSHEESFEPPVSTVTANISSKGAGEGSVLGTTLGSVVPLESSAADSLESFSKC